MSLPADTVALLFEHRLLTHVRESLDAALAQLAQEREQAEVTRPPFGGFLTSRRTIAAHEEVTRSVEDDGAALHARLAQLEELEHWLAPRLHTAVHEHLWAESGDYRAGHELRTLAASWAAGTTALDEMLTALLRETRALAAVLSGHASGSFRDSAATREEAQAALLRAARNHDHQLAQINSLAGAFAAVATGTSFASVALPPQPEGERIAWALDLAPQAEAAALVSVEGALAEFALLQRGRRAELPAAAQTAAAACLALEHHLLAEHTARLLTECAAPDSGARDPDAILAEVAARRRARDEQAHRESLTNAPFRLDL